MNENVLVITEDVQHFWLAGKGMMSDGSVELLFELAITVDTQIKENNILTRANSIHMSSGKRTYNMDNPKHSTVE